MTNIKHVCCIGAGFVGTPTMAVLAKHNPDKIFTIVDIDAEKINAWKGRNPSNYPVREHGLPELLESPSNIVFTTDLQSSIYRADIIFISVNTPTKSYGEGIGEKADLRYIESCARTILQYSASSKIIVEKSTVPVRTSDMLKTILKSTEDIKFSILSNPEFLAEGTAINDLENPSRVLIGHDEHEYEEAKILASLYHFVDDSKIVFSSTWSSELAKLVSNAFLAQRVSSINSISELCEASGADVTEISKIIGMDDRIGNKFIHAGAGYGGSCFTKDILNLVYIAKSYHLYEVAEYWNNVLKINEHQKKRVARKVVSAMNGISYAKSVTIYGLSFKPDTNDTRESPAIDIIKYLIDEYCSVNVIDKNVSLTEAKQALGAYFDKLVSYNNEIHGNPDAIVLMHNDSQFTTGETFKRISKYLREGVQCIDVMHSLPNGFTNTSNYIRIGFTK